MPGRNLKAAGAGLALTLAIASPAAASQHPATATATAAATAAATAERSAGTPHAAVLHATAPLAAAPHTSAPHAAAQHAPAPAMRPVTMAGLTAPSYTVTLPTGDKVRLAGDGSGHYSVTTQPGTAGGDVAVTAISDAHAIRTLYAFPAAAAALIRTGRVDARLFDVHWLAAHGDTGSAGTLPVTVRFSGSPPAALPGATVVSSTAHTLTLRVRAADAARFWAALAGHAGSGTGSAPASMHPALAAGIERAWPAGDQPKTQAHPADQRIYDVTENVTFTRAVTGGASTMDVGVPLIIGISGDGKGQASLPTGAQCLDAACTQVQVTYSVPSGAYMIEDNSAAFFTNNHMQLLDIAIPQFIVAGDTTVSVNADKAVRYSVSAPRSAVPYETLFEGVRGFPGGGSESSITPSTYSSGTGLWAVPTAPVTMGSYRSTTVWRLGARPLTVRSDPAASLDITYPDFNNADERFTRFSGSRTMQLADAGYGTAQDFSGQDVHGKLVLIRADPGTETIERDQMDNALQAGAAGVLAVAYTGRYSVVPFVPGWMLRDTQPAPSLPLAEIPASDASKLVAFIQQGTVKLHITDNSATDYLYSLSFSSEGQVPGSGHYTVSDDQLDQVDASYQDDYAGKVSLNEAVLRPDDHVVGASVVDTFAPLNVHILYGPVDPELVWWRQPFRWHPDLQFSSIWGYNVFDRAKGDPETWFDKSEVPGGPTLAQDVFASHPGMLNGARYEDWCSFCRLGDVFFPQFDMVSGQSPRLLDGFYQFDPSYVHLYLNGTEIPHTTNDGQDSYQLPPAEGDYRLTTAAGNLDTTWTFSSARPQQRGMADGYFCLAAFIDKTDPCAAVPLILLRYNAFTDVNDAITAGGKHRLRISSYDQATAAPTDLTSVKFWTSTDGGATWQQARVSRGSDGSFLADYSVPKLSATNGKLSIRAQATDAAGGTIDQTYYDDYALTAG